MTVFTTRKHNTAELLKMHYLQNIHFSGVYIPVTLYLVIGALHLGLPSLPKDMHITVGLGISVTENDIYVTIVLWIFVLENYTWPLPRNDPEGMGGYTQRT